MPVVWSYPTCFVYLLSAAAAEQHHQRPARLSLEPKELPVYRVPQLCSAEHGAGAAAGNQSAAACAGSMAWGQERSSARR